MTPITFDSPPIIIVAAGRSGSKMLRSIIGSHPRIAYFPREINYIWRHGNTTFPTDELRPEHARPEVVQYIRKRFQQFSQSHHGARVLEKTCANSLRVEFVHAVFPEAYIIHLVRDGRAVAESARRRWLAKPELKYLLEKARWVPVQDIPYYGLRFLKFQLKRFGNESKAPSSWGPRFAGLDDLVREKSLIEVCSIQWRTCVEAAEDAFSRLPANQVITVRYEDLVQSPLEVSEQIFQSVGLDFAPESQQFIREFVTTSNLDKWRKHLSQDDLRLLLPHIESTLAKFGYTD